MDVHMHAKPRHPYQLNGCHQINDDGLQFLSREEQECIAFFENTIDSLDENFNDETVSLSSRNSATPGEVRASSSSVLNSTQSTTLTPNLLENDIIDLVHSSTDYVMPDFQGLVVAPDTHYDMKSKKDHSQSSISGPSSNSEAYEENGPQPPPGAIPTPVVIANQIAETRGSGIVSPSILLDRRRSMETKRDPSVAAKPSHLPSNIRISRGGRDPSPHSIATEAVSLQERRSQMLSNLPAGAHPLEGGEPACVRNLPTRSVSFKDPTPEKSRMEALAKLGLTGDKSSNYPTHNLPKVSSYTPATSNGPNKVLASSSTKMASNPNYSASKSGSSSIATASNSSPVSGPTTSNIQRKSNSFSVSNSSPSSNHEAKPKYEISSSSFGGRTAVIIPTSKNPVSQGRRSSTNSVSPEVAHPGFNSYGGKSLMLNPTTKPDPALSPTSSGTHEPADIKLNSYGGKSRTIHPSHTDVPDGPTSHSTPQASSPSDINRSRVFPPSPTSYDLKAKSPSHPSSHPDSVHHPLTRSRTIATTTSSTSPKPPSTSGSFRPRSDPVPPEILSKPAPSFRNQGVTVQFCGKGTTEESKRDALRKLGLLKNTP